MAMTTKSVIGYHLTQFNFLYIKLSYGINFLYGFVFLVCYCTLLIMCNCRFYINRVLFFGLTWFEPHIFCSCCRDGIRSNGVLLLLMTSCWATGIYSFHYKDYVAQKIFAVLSLLLVIRIQNHFSIYFFYENKLKRDGVLMKIITQDETPFLTSKLNEIFWQVGLPLVVVRQILSLIKIDVCSWSYFFVSEKNRVQLQTFSPVGGVVSSLDPVGTWLILLWKNNPNPNIQHHNSQWLQNKLTMV